ncbi:sigma-54-dependent Fis family transcriptional regulator [Alicyclobacillus sp.]|uniref:sigma-54-dependent Fis family transcriptional regulator n=1 Tax=Alicyclobacillus sp. TaxID=61169 RepID=UPI0025C34AB5|nr:sigma-54-dependent Fis family transcriptional regulator [Alicyclobacillus sp.]MCL6515793.1 sigma-54-dependent Fis family transcriptional regulator [Alicyclobacillus sp.]
MHVVIVGAGQGGCRWMEALSDHAEVEIDAVVDRREDAPGVHLAREKGIRVARDYRRVFAELPAPVDVVLEVTGDPDVYRDLMRLAPEATVISGPALRFFTLFLDDKMTLIRRLQAQRRELERVVEATHDGMVGVDHTGRIVLCNAAAERLLGLPRDQVLGRPVQEVIPNTRLAEVLAHGREELNQVQKLGDTEIVTNRVPLFDDEGRIVGVIATFRDVTELRALAAEVTNLREVQTLLEAIIQSTQDAISVVDKDGRGLLINPAYTRLTGLRPEQVLNQPADVDIAEGESMHLRVLRTGQPVRNVPMKVGPMRREVLVDVAPILVGGELRGSVGVIHDVSEIKRLTEELERANKLIRTMQAKYTFDEIVGQSPAIALAVEQARRAAETPATVLLRGESGTGKELFAHAIHNASDRRYRPFVRVNCAALSDSLLESELFGYEEGAFTGARKGGKRGLFEEASGGTLFLDEIGEMSVATQAKLLRALQEREILRVGGTRTIPVDVRVIAATHVNLEQAVAEGRFREDLYYRLNVIPIVIPPLRYRLEDIEALALHIIQRQNQAYGRNVTAISRAAVELLQQYGWPGNVRELENTIGRAMIHMRYNETVLEAHHLPVLHRAPAPLAASTGQTASAWPPLPEGTLAEQLRAAERAAIERALRASGGNKTEAARRLGISVRSLYYKLKAPSP